MPPDDENRRTPASKMQAQRGCARRFAAGRRRADRPRRLAVGGEQDRMKRFDRSRPLWFRGMIRLRQGFVGQEGRQNQRQASKQHVHLPHDHVLGFRSEAGLWMVECGGATSVL